MQSFFDYVSIVLPDQNVLEQYSGQLYHSSNFKLYPSPIQITLNLYLSYIFLCKVFTLSLFLIMPFFINIVLKLYRYFVLYGRVYTIIQIKTLHVFCLLQQTYLYQNSINILSFIVNLFLSIFHRYFVFYNRLTLISNFISNSNLTLSQCFSTDHSDQISVQFETRLRY